MRTLALAGVVLWISLGISCKSSQPAPSLADASTDASDDSPWIALHPVPGQSLNVVPLIWGSGPDLYVAGQALLRSSDGARTWTVVDPGASLVGFKDGKVYSMSGVVNQVWVSGALRMKPWPFPFVIVTGDRGATWTDWTPASASGTVRGVWTRGAGLPVLAVTDSGQIFRSADGQEPFSLIVSDETVAFEGVWGTAGDVMYTVGTSLAVTAGASGTQASADGAAPTDAAGQGSVASHAEMASAFILRSLDAGLTWTQVVTLPGGGLRSVSGTPDGRRVLAVGYRNRWALSVDGGLNWDTARELPSENDHRFDYEVVTFVPGDAAPYITSPPNLVSSNLLRGIDGDGVTWFEEVPEERLDSQTYTKWPRSVWGDMKGNVWAVGQGAAVWHRR